MFGRDYLCVELMSKFPAWDLGIDRSAVALSKFREVEESLSWLKLTGNQRIVVGRKSTTMQAVIETARRKIAKILGDLDLDEVYSFFAFGPGASTSLSRRRSDAAFKFGALRPQLTYNAVSLADALSKKHPTWQFNAEVVAGSRLTTVPKNAKTDRCICIEPELNMYFQKGLGRYIRKRLNRWGLLLPTAQQYNAQLAREGSANGRLATVDLSSASDSIHMGLTALLLPYDVVDIIGLMRSPAVVLPNEEIHYLRKVSSMGNGFTFELETLIFYGLCSAVIELLASKEMDHRCTVFGDDIVIDSELVPALREVLSFCGFEMNPKKTFSSGPFRESCGKHYFAGNDVTPFYIREPIDTVLRKYWAANTVRRYSRLPWGLEPRWAPVYHGIVESIPRAFRRFQIPEGVGDGGLIADWDEVRPSRSNHGFDSWTYQSIVPKNRPIKLEGQGTLLKCLHSMEFPRGEPQVDSVLIDQKAGVINSHVIGLIVRSLGNKLSGSHIDAAELIEFMSQRDRHGAICLTEIPQPRGYRVRKGHIQQWPSFGPWL
jgi:hypothetical protein